MCNTVINTVFFFSCSDIHVRQNINECLCSEPFLCLNFNSKFEG